MVQRYEMLWEYKALASSQMRRQTASLSRSLQLPWGLNWSCSGQLMPFSSNKCMLQIMQTLQTHFPNTSDMNFSATRKRPAWNSNTKCKVAVVGRSLWSDVKCTFLEKSCFLETRNSFSLVRKDTTSTAAHHHFSPMFIPMIFPCATQKLRIPHEYIYIYE